MPHLIVLNGISSSGKSSLAKALQQILPDPYLHYQLDAFLHMMAIRDASYENYKLLHETMHDAALVFLQHNHNLIIDTVVTGDTAAAMRTTFQNSRPFYVGVKASLEKIQQREQQRGDRDIGLAASQYDRVHQNMTYHLEVDTSDQTPEQAARIVATYYQAFQSD